MYSGDHIRVIETLAHSRIGNYILPGLDSHLIGGPGHGLVRLFDSSRDQQQEVTPHSHRFDFACLVLQGQVRNRVWRPTVGEGDLFMSSWLHYRGSTGKYDRAPGSIIKMDYTDHEHTEGDWYCMDAEEVHSIWFGRNTKVLFFEGPSKHDSTKIYEPWINDVTIPTFKVEPWMFARAMPPSPAAPGGEG